MGSAGKGRRQGQPGEGAEGSKLAFGQVDLFLLGVRLAGSIAVATGSIPGGGGGRGGSGGRAGWHASPWGLSRGEVLHQERKCGINPWGTWGSWVRGAHCPPAMEEAMSSSLPFNTPQ